MPAAGYEIDFLASAGSTAATRCEAARARSGRRPRRAARRAGVLARARGADVVLGGGGYVAGPVGLAAAVDAGCRSC